ncbi:MAG: phosphatase PAP2 family protein [Streptosporangiaceae bacterium]|jgi:hypothetical protein
MSEMIKTRSARLLPARERGRPAATAPPPASGHWLVWPRLPAVLEVLTLGAGYAAPSLVRLALPADSRAAFAHAAAIYRAEQHLHLNIEPILNHLVSGDAVPALAVGYYYGLLHFIVTPLVLAWLYQRRPADFPRLRSALVLASVGANIVFWTWPVAPPRFAVPGMADVLVTRDILGSADPHGVTSAVNLYAAMPSLHVCWAAWCAVAVVVTTRSRSRHLAWLYPAATAFVVLSSANHFVLDVIGGLVVAAFGMTVTGRRSAQHDEQQLQPAGLRSILGTSLRWPAPHPCHAPRRLAEVERAVFGFR